MSYHNLLIMLIVKDQDDLIKHKNIMNYQIFDKSQKNYEVYYSQFIEF